MTSEDFICQMNRLKAVYGERAYPQERAELIWAEFKSDGAWMFTTIVSNMIGEHRTPPVMSDFRIERAKIRERFAGRQNKEPLTNSVELQEPTITYAEYVRRCVDDKRSEEIGELLRVWGIPWVEIMYEKGVKEKQTGIPDKTNVAAMFEARF